MLIMLFRCIENVFCVVIKNKIAEYTRQGTRIDQETLVISSGKKNIFKQESFMSNLLEVDTSTAIANQASITNTDLQQLMTLRQFCSIFAWPSESAMRSYVYKADELGLSDAFIRVRRRLLIVPKIFFTLIKQVENRSQKGGSYGAESTQKRKNG